jgi:hypothetical protein
VNQAIGTGLHFSLGVGPHPHALYALRATAFGLAAPQWRVLRRGLMRLLQQLSNGDHP